MNDNKWLGRKYTITIMCIVATCGLAVIGKMNGDVALVLAAAIGSFNYALRNTG